jgi:hypothetical protein
MSKYLNLNRFFEELPQDINNIRLEFDQIEKIIDDQLPLSAYKYSEWWQPHSHPHCKSWTDAGFIIKEKSLELKYVVFEKKTKKTTP